MERREFSKAEAWIDILMEARSKEEPATVIIGNQVLVCNYAETLCSLETWAKRWGWSKSKVKRVLDLFKSCSMIELKNETVTTRIRVLKYSEFDIKRNAYETQVKRKRNASETQVEPNKNEKNEKNEKKNPPTPLNGGLPCWLDRNLWNEFKAFRVAAKARMTPHAEKLAISELSKLKESGQNPSAVIEQSIMRGWKGLYAISDSTQPNKATTSIDNWVPPEERK
jgi:hypothetical protein